MAVEQVMQRVDRIAKVVFVSDIDAMAHYKKSVRQEILETITFSDAHMEAIEEGTDEAIANLLSKKVQDARRKDGEASEAVAQPQKEELKKKKNKKKTGCLAAILLLFFAAAMVNLLDNSRNGSYIPQDQNQYSPEVSRMVMSRKVDRVYENLDKMKKALATNDAFSYKLAIDMLRSSAEGINALQLTGESARYEPYRVELAKEIPLLCDSVTKYVKKTGPFEDAEQHLKKTFNLLDGYRAAVKDQAWEKVN